MKPTSAEMPRQLVRRFGLLVLLTLLGAIAGGAYGALKTPTYVAQAYVVVTGQPGEPAAAINFAQAFGRIVTTGPVADKAAATLGSGQDLKQVTTSTSPDTPVIEITAITFKGIVVSPPGAFLGTIETKTPLPVTQMITLERHSGTFRIVTSPANRIEFNPPAGLPAPTTATPLSLQLFVNGAIATPAWITS